MFEKSKIKMSFMFLREVHLGDLSKHAWQFHTVHVCVGLIALFLSSQIFIPLEPVPITLQSVGVMLVAFSLPPKAAIHTIISYVLLGAMGLPLFGGFSGGMAVLAGHTGGYLIGFIPAVYVMSKAKTFLDMSSSWKIFVNCVLGSLCIYSFGVTWLAYHLGSFDKAIVAGLMPFIFPGLIKAGLLSLSLCYIHRDLDKEGA